MKHVYMDKDFCIGCGLCELACLTAHSKSGDLILAFVDEAAGGLRSCKKVHRDGSECASIGCRHCDEPSCVAACISGALYKDLESGRTVYQKEKCVGCWSCMMACPYGAISRHPVEAKIVKCDRCPDREVPACVTACPNLALKYEER